MKDFNSFYTEKAIKEFTEFCEYEYSQNPVVFEMFVSAYPKIEKLQEKEISELFGWGKKKEPTNPTSGLPQSLYPDPNRVRDDKLKADPNKYPMANPHEDDEPLPMAEEDPKQALMSFIQNFRKRIQQKNPQVAQQAEQLIGNFRQQFVQFKNAANQMLSPGWKPVAGVGARGPGTFNTTSYGPPR